MHVRSRAYLILDEEISTVIELVHVEHIYRFTEAAIDPENMDPLKISPSNMIINTELPEVTKVDDITYGLRKSTDDLCWEFSVNMIQI